MNALSTPDITAVQKIVGALSAVIVAVVGLVNAFNWATITATQSASLLGVWAALGSVFVIADAVIRNGRSRAFTVPPKGVVADDHAGGA